MSPSERLILDHLTDFIVYAGRYPVPSKVEGMEPVKTPDGHTSHVANLQRKLEMADPYQQTHAFLKALRTIRRHTATLPS